MKELITIKGLKGKQNKKKWNKNIDVTGLLDKIQQQNTAKIRSTFPSTLTVEIDNQNIRKPLDPNRFKSRPTPLPKTKYNNKIKKQSILDQPIEDAWTADKQVRSKYKKPEVPAIIKPSTGHSYNPSQQDLKKIVDTIIDYEGQKQKKTKQIKKPTFKVHQVRHRNKNVRKQQLQIRERKIARQQLHQVHSANKIAKNIEEKQKQIELKIKQEKEKEKKWEEQAKKGKVRYGKKLGKNQYKWKEDLPNVQQTGKKLSHVGGNEDLIKDRFDSVYRRGIFEARTIKVHSNKTKKIKTSLRYRDEKQEQTKKKKDEIAFIK